VSIAGAAAASCTADVGPVAGASEFGQQQGTEEIGQTQIARLSCVSVLCA
jgi:hypothetical protein